MFSTSKHFTRETHFESLPEICSNVRRRQVILISNFRRVLNVVCFLLGDSPASEINMPTFQNTLFHLHRQAPTCLWRWNRRSVSKRQHINFRCRGITQKKAYNNRRQVLWSWQHSLKVHDDIRSVTDSIWLCYFQDITDGTQLHKMLNDKCEIIADSLSIVAPERTKSGEYICGRLSRTSKQY